MEFSFSSTAYPVWMWRKGHVCSLWDAGSTSGKAAFVSYATINLNEYICFYIYTVTRNLGYIFLENL